MVSLTDYQLRIVMGAARGLPVEKRDIFQQRIAAMLALRGCGRFPDTDVADVVQLARERRLGPLAFVDTPNKLATSGAFEVDVNTWL